MNSVRLYILDQVFNILPATRCFAFKRWLLRWCGATVGKNVSIVSSVRFFLSGDLIIGDDVWIGQEVLIVGGGAAVEIGSHADIGPRVTIVTGSHRLWESPNRAAGTGFSQPIVIADGVWLGAGATVLGGLRVGKAAAVAAGAVVIRDVVPYSLQAGNPSSVKRLHSC